MKKILGAFGRWLFATFIVYAYSTFAIGIIKGMKYFTGWEAVGFFFLLLICFIVVVLCVYNFISFMIKGKD